MRINLILLVWTTLTVALTLPDASAQPPNSNGTDEQSSSATGDEKETTVQPPASNDSSSATTQPPRTTQPRTTRPSPSTPRRRATRPGRRPPALQRLTARRYRLARAPDMLGDSFLPPLQLTHIAQVTNGFNAHIQLPVAGGSARSKIGEFNKAMPVDRFYASYNHFHNAVTQDAFNVGLGQSLFRNASADRFTLGAERTLLDGDTSIEVRLPLTEFPTLASSVAGAGPFGDVTTGSSAVGNVSLIGKQLLVDQDDLIVSAGLGVELPLGDDGGAQLSQVQFLLENETVFLQPFIAATLDNGTTWFHTFLQVDIDTVGNSFSSRDLTAPGQPVTSFGRIRQQTLIHFDASVGQWLYRDSSQSGITGIAAIAEVHVSAAASSGGNINGIANGALGPVDVQVDTSNAFPQTYITTGLHTEISGRHMLRLAGVFPVASRNRRLFDAEVLVQFGTRY